MERRNEPITGVSVAGHAPWATTPRLADVEAALPEDAAALLEAAARGAAEHARRVEEDVLLLYAGGNVPLAPPAHLALLSAQPSMGFPGAKYQAGLEPLDEVEVAVTRLVARTMGARFADVRPTSATLANLAVYTAVAQPGDTVAVLAGWAGGHLSHHEVGAAGVRGLRVAELPYDADALDVDVDALPAFLQRERPALVVVGASLMLRPHRLGAIAEAVHEAGAVLLYDASHVAGLLAEGELQAPLAEGADLVTFSTYKSFGGPAGGVVAGDDEALMARVSAAVYPGLVANYDLARLLPLGEAALAHLHHDGYARRCIALARALGAALEGEGLRVVGGPRTATHHVCVDARDAGGGTAAAMTLAEAGVLLSEIGLPDGQDPAGGIRIGTQSVVRQGMGEAHAPAVARAIADVLLGRRTPAEVAPEVRELRRSL